MSFALWRLPWQKDIRQVLGRAVVVDSARNLNCQHGFVIAPFASSFKSPIVVITPSTGQAMSVKEALANCHVDGVADDVGHNATSYEQYCQTFTNFTAPLREGTLQKIVLSRQASVNLNTGIDFEELFRLACDRYPRTFVYLCHTPQTGTWLGATPELLLSGNDKEWHTIALAGTQTWPAHEWDEKNIREQALVADYIRQTVGKAQEEGPTTVRAGSLAHIRTDFRFQMDDDKMGELIERLHPSPAVCGLPKNEALAHILAHEGYDRAYYAGYLGWLDPNGQTDLYVNLRCMRLRGSTATLYAGSGLLPQSTEQEEWAETENKLYAMDSILREVTSS